MKNNFVVLYHRQPFEEVLCENQIKYNTNSKPNGIIPLLKGFFKTVNNGIWIAGSEFADHPGVAKHHHFEVEKDGNTCTLRRVLITKDELRKFYHQTSKDAFWPILHSFEHMFDLNSVDWETFVIINQRFADAAIEEVGPGCKIWIHDYNFWLVPAMIRDKLPDAQISFFLHTPFPAADVFNVLPWRKQIIESLLAADYINFSIPRYVENFVATAKATVILKNIRKKKVGRRFSSHGHALSEPEVTVSLQWGAREVWLNTLPVGTDCDYIDVLTKKRSVLQTVNQIKRKFKGCQIIFSASRLDYIKGIDKLLESFQRILELREDLRGKVVLSVVAVAPAAGINTYNHYQRQVLYLVSAINEKFSKDGWMPVIYSHNSYEFEELICLYKAADIMWVPSLRDGTNLVCKEFIAIKKGGKGVLVLSEFVGAAVELQGAVLTNPYSSDSMDQAILLSLTMSVLEQKKRMKLLYKSIMLSDIKVWSNPDNFFTGIGKNEQFLKIVEANK